MDEKGEVVDIDLVRRQDFIDQVFQERTVKLLVVIAMLSGFATWVIVGGGVSFSMFELLSTTNIWITAGALFNFIGLAVIYLSGSGLKLLGWLMSTLGVHGSEHILRSGSTPASGSSWGSYAW